MDTIYQLCKNRVNTLVTSDCLKHHGFSNEELAGNITEIVLRNLASGRVQRVVDRFKSGPQNPASNGNQAQPQQKIDDDKLKQTEAQLPVAYIDRVITIYLNEHRRVERLGHKDEAEWVALFNQLVSWAYRTLLRQQISAVRARDEALDFAQETCYAIYSNAFPYDVPFNAWATAILNNFVLHRCTRSRDLIDRKPEAVMPLYHPRYQDCAASHFSLCDILADEASMLAFDQVDMQEWLIQAILQLKSQAQQQVIIYTYFYDLSDEEIANRIEKTKNAVYILRHRALQQLQNNLKCSLKEVAVQAH